MIELIFWVLALAFMLALLFASFYLFFIALIIWAICCIIRFIFKVASRSLVLGFIVALVLLLLLLFLF